MGRALGTLMSDQIFPLEAYRARSPTQMFSAFDSYTQEVTVLSPSVWDPETRLEPPKQLPKLDERLAARSKLPSTPLIASSVSTPGQIEQQPDEIDVGVVICGGGGDGDKSGGGAGKEGGQDSPPKYDTLLPADDEEKEEGEEVRVAGGHNNIDDD